jgi:hypothetical protein
VSPDRAWQLVDTERPSESALAGLVPAPAADGLPAKDTMLLLANIPPRAEASGQRRFRMEPAKAGAKDAPAAAGFRFVPVSDKSVALWEGQRPVLVYNYGVMSKAGVPANLYRSTYVHPLYGVEGEVLTDDFPKDHYHHRGLFWAWPHVIIDGKPYDLWAIQGIVQRFEHWLGQQASPAAAVLGVENGWFVGEKKVVQERVWLRIYPVTADERTIDLEFTWIPLGKSVTLAGAEGKSYGGLTLRFAPGTNTTITIPAGRTSQDLYMTNLPWADLTRLWSKEQTSSGAAIFVHPGHPDYRPQWLTRHYGVLCLGWPGVKPATFQPGATIRCQYRLRIHRGRIAAADLQKAYQDYVATGEIVWEQANK